MLKQSLEFLRNNLNEYLASKEPAAYGPLANRPAMICDIVDQKGELYIKAEAVTRTDFVLLSLVNIEEETVGKSQLPYYRNAEDALSILNPDLKINFYLMFTAVSRVSGGNELRYGNCLKLLSYIISYFQYQHVFTKQTFPGLDDSIERLVVELMNLNLEQLNHLWATVGAKYMPSIVYKVRMLTYREIIPKQSEKLIEEIVTNEHSKV